MIRFDQTHDHTLAILARYFVVLQFDESLQGRD
jgi:hypothetical protein